MADSTFSLVAVLTLGWLLITLETVCCETPATLATSSSRGNRALLLLIIVVRHRRLRRDYEVRGDL
ncbi:hypothetical protein [Pseudarthrobacter sp. NamE5]|uniref:hypothetical protein n=1 Tax=Pseudarthrobacter sp. NamE5 TaxID=2576839 RepID=UPI001F0DCCDE|nr:hypothetical protein [Pseudarthrobacter sp. NamE5]